MPHCATTTIEPVWKFGPCGPASIAQILKQRTSRGRSESENHNIVDVSESHGASYSYAITDDFRRRVDELRLAFSHGAPLADVSEWSGARKNYGRPLPNP
jgi:hypothetical protein